MVVRDMHVHRSRLAVALCAAMIGLVVAGVTTAVATGALAGGEGPPVQQLPGAQTSAPPKWPTNANGQTYGSLLDSTSSATQPVLAQVIATNGAAGYVYSSQLNPPAPTSPTAAVTEQAANMTGQFIPVYAQDGTTVIGQFEASEPGSVP
jgi:hypothetical protein